MSIPDDYAIRVPVCSGLTARWCPVHGDCACPETADSDRALDDPGCPLHSPTSEHEEAS